MKNKPKNVISLKQQPGKAGILKIISIIAASGISVWLIVNLYKRSRQKASASRAASDPNVQMAMRLNSAIYPSQSWVGDLFTSVNKDEIFRIAPLIKKNFNDVSKEYYNLYEEPLALELQNALKGDYDTFLRIISGDTMSDTQAAAIAKQLYEEIGNVTYFNAGFVDTQPVESFNNLPASEQALIGFVYQNLYGETLKSDLENLKIKLGG
jgi:hypothetical protein